MVRWIGLSAIGGDLKPDAVSSRHFTHKKAGHFAVTGFLNASFDQPCLIGAIEISTRRFCARPAGLAFEATGRSGP